MIKCFYFRHVILNVFSSPVRIKNSKFLEVGSIPARRDVKNISSIYKE